MAALTGNKIKDSYLGLLKSIDNAPFFPRASGTFVQISDGGGNSLPLYLSTTSINFYNAYTFPSADGTISGQVLSTNANGTLSWITSSDNQTLQEVLTQGNTTDLEITTSAQFNGDINGALLQKVKAAEVLSKGDVVYISGGTGDNPEVSKAKADSSTTMPALGIMKEPLALNAEGECITSGELTGVDLTGIATGAELFVSSATAGELVITAPTGEANLIQKIGKVIKGGNGGALTVLGAFRTNAMPNLPTGIILGDTTNVATAITDGTSAGQILSTDGNGTYSFINDNAITSAVSPLNLSPNQISLGTVGVDKGGTGAITLTGILLGNATSAISGITSAVDGHVLTADGNGGYAFEVASGDVTVDGASVGNRVAVWNNTTGELRGTSAIATENSNIYLVQPSTNGTDKFNYIIGGAFAINENDFGIQNTGFGHAVLNGADLTGGSNSSFGMQSQTALTTGSHNTSIGSFAMYDNRSGDYNVGLGAKTMFNQRISNNNVSIGYDSMDGVVASRTAESNNNVAIGYESLHIIEGGDNNTVLGYQSGSAITTGSNNVIIGSNTGSTIPTSSNNIIISDGSGNIRQSFDINGAATFSGSVTAVNGVYTGTGEVIANTASGTLSKYIRLSNNSGHFYCGVEGATSDIITGAPAYDASIRGYSGLSFSANGGSSLQMRISSGGKITFDSAYRYIEPVATGDILRISQNYHANGIQIGLDDTGTFYPKLSISSGATGGDVTASNKKNSSTLVDKTTTPYAEEKIYQITQVSGTSSFDICTITNNYNGGTLIVECVLTGQWAAFDQAPASYNKSIVTCAVSSISVNNLDSYQGLGGLINFTFVSRGVFKINITSMGGNGRFNGIAYVRVIGGNASSSSQVAPLGFTLS